MSVSVGRDSQGQSTTHDRYSVHVPQDRYILPIFLSDRVFGVLRWVYFGDLVPRIHGVHLLLMRLQSTLPPPRPGLSPETGS